MVESTAVSCIQSSHPDKNNNSVDRIISKEEEREDPRRDSSIYLRVQWCFHKYKTSSNTVYSYKNYSVSTRNPASFPVIPCKETILHTELILLQEILQLQGSSRVIPCIQGIFQQLFPCLQALHTADSSYKAPYSSRAIQYKQASSNSTRQKQHSTRQPASTQSLQ